MRAWNIDSFIEANKLLQGDVVQIGQLVFGLSSSYLVFMGRDMYQRPVFSGMVESHVHWIGVEDMVRVFQASAPTRVHRFQGTQDQRLAVMTKTNANLNEDTFTLMLNWATGPKPKPAASTGDNIGAAVGGVLLGAAVIALIAAIFDRDK